jgi:hypothetical protein
LIKEQAPMKSARFTALTKRFRERTQV